ncbi:MAG: TolC family protein [Planctomycetota bacterium]
MGTSPCLCATVILSLALGACAQAPRSAPVQQPESAASATEVDPAETAQRELPQPLDLRQAVAHALARNPDMQVAAARLRQAQAQLRLAGAALHPTLQLEVEYLQSEAPSTYLFKTIDQRELPPQVDFNDPGRVENLETGLGLQYSLYNGGRDQLNQRQAAVGVELASVGTAATRNQLIAGVMTTWYRIDAAEAMLRTAETSVETVQAQLQETRTVYEAGGEALKSDVLSLRARLAEAEEAVISARNARRLAVAALLELLGETGELRPDISLGEDQPLTIPEDPDQLLTDALRLRPELRRARLAIEEARLDAELAAAAWRPTVGLNGRVYWDDEDVDYASDATNWMAALSLQWLLYDGGARGHQHEMALTAIEQMRAMDRKQLLAVRADLRRSQLQLEDAQARLQTASTGVDAAAESLELVAARYTAGAATVTRYLEAELMLNKARLRRIRAETDLRQARVDLARASGYFLRGDAP